MDLEKRIKVFSIYDKTQERYLMPFFHKTVEEMVQNIQMIIVKGNTHMSMFPGRYHVEHIADLISNAEENRKGYFFDETIRRQEYKIEEIMKIGGEVKDD